MFLSMCKVRGSRYDYNVPSSPKVRRTGVSDGPCTPRTSDGVVETMRVGS